MPATRPDVDPREPHGLSDLCFFALCVLLLGPGIWSESGITGQDEYFLSFRTVLEMQERDSWLVPYVNGEVRLQKPPLLYWSMRAAFEVLGANLFAARIWTVLAGAALALYTARISRLLFGGGGYLAGLMVVSAAGVAIESRRAMFDLPVGALCTMAIYHGLVWWRTRGFGSAIGTGLCLGLAAMTKGPVALWFFVAPLLAMPIVRPPVLRDDRERRGAASTLLGVLLLALVFAAVALPWPLWVQHAHPEFWQVMQTQVEHREFGLPEPKRVLGLPAAALGLCVPWSVCVVAGAIAALRSGDRTMRWFVLWIVVGALPFLFLKTFERYLLALVCPMALCAAQWLGGVADPTRRLHLTVATSLVGVPVVVFSAFALWFGLSYVWSLLALLGLYLTVRVARRERPDAPLCAAMCGALLMLLLGFVYPRIGINRLPDDLPEGLQEARVCTFGRPQPGMLSMRLGRSVQQLSAEPAGLVERLAAYEGYLFVLADDGADVRGTAAVEAAAAQAGVRCVAVQQFTQFYSRKTWLKFFKQGVGGGDWWQALLARSPEPLMPRFVCYRIG